MEITGTVHLLFEQSGIFTTEFRLLGFRAISYDICDDFGQTDNKIDIFKQIYRASEKRSSMFDNMSPDDLLIAFFPCTYFSSMNYTFFQGINAKWKGLTQLEKLKRIEGRAIARQYYYMTLLKLLQLVEDRSLRLIVENPYKDNYLVRNLPYKPVVELNRRIRGDVYTKPTMYYFINCEPSHLCTIQLNKPKKYIKYTNGDTLERSIISADYARNFINDYVLGRKTERTQPTLFS